MRRIISPLLGLLLLLGGSSVVLARQNAPAATEEAPGIVVTQLAGVNLVHRPFSFGRSPRVGERFLDKLGMTMVW